MTPEQYGRAMTEFASKLSNIKPVLSKTAKKVTNQMKYNVYRGKNADGTPMDPLTGLTLKGNVTGTGRKRSAYGSKPLKATGEMVRSFKSNVDDRGWVAYVADDFKRKVSFWQGNVPTGLPLRIKPRSDKSGRAMARAMAGKGMPVKPSTAASGFIRPARLPFALNAKQVRKSVKDLNAHVLKPFLR
jgi:hypothetical protein